MANKVRFTSNRVAGFKCLPEKAQAFLWDLDQKGLGLRATPAGKPSYIFQSRFNGKTIRVTIGSPDNWSISEAQTRARGLQRIIDEGRDPRRVKAEATADDLAARDAIRRESVSVGDAWDDYLKERRKHWSDNHYKDHLKMVQKAGQPVKNRPSMKTTAGMMVPLMSLRLVDLDAKTLEKWAAKESKRRPTRVRLSIRLVKAFLRWAANEDAYRSIADPAAASGKKLREIPGQPKTKKDHIEREQLPTWFQHVRSLPNPVISAFLQCLVLTGARREELGCLQWKDVNFRWQGLTLGDKIEESRAIPLTPYVASLLQSLPRRNGWVFSSTASESGRLVEPAIAHRQACKAAGLELTLHGLRRSFKTLSEWQEIPVGVVAQIMGHKPSATAEKHYTVRPLDLLRVHHERIEHWVLEQAGIEFTSEGEPAVLRLVSSASNQPEGGVN
jgi:integrase